MEKYAKLKMKMSEVNPNVLVICNDVSDIFEHFVNDNGKTKLIIA